MSSTCLHNIGPLAAEIDPVVLGTLQISTGFASWQRYCTASSSGRQPTFAALNRGRHQYSAGRPSRWALAHISSISQCLSQFQPIAFYWRIHQRVQCEFRLVLGSDWRQYYDSPSFTVLAAFLAVKTVIYTVVYLHGRTMRGACAIRASVYILVWAERGFST